MYAFFPLKWNKFSANKLFAKVYIQGMFGVVRLNSVRRWLLSCIQFVTFHTSFEKDSDVAHTPMMEGIKWLLYRKTKKRKHFQNRFCSENLGQAPRACAGPWARPPFLEQNDFENVSAFLFCDITIIWCLPSLECVLNLNLSQK